MLAEVVVDMTGSRSKIEFRPLPTDDPRQRKPDISKAEKLLGWTPKVGFTEGLRSTIAYFDALLSQSDDAFAGHMPLTALQANWPRVANMD